MFFLTLILRLFDSYHCKELVGGNVVQGKRNAEPKGSSQIKCAAQELTGLGVLGGVEPVKRAFVTPDSIIG